MASPIGVVIPGRTNRFTNPISMVAIRALHLNLCNRIRPRAILWQLAMWMILLFIFFWRIDRALEASQHPSFHSTI